MALTTRGAGKSDYSAYIPRVGTIGVGGGRGSISYVSRMGTLGEGGGRGSIAYVGRIGTLGAGGGTGTISYVKRMGTLAHVGSQPYLGYLGTARVRSGSIRVTFAAQDIMVGVDQQSRYFSGLVIRDRVPLGPGSQWRGSWYGVGSFGQWRFYVMGRPSAGSFAVIGGVTGTGLANATGTIFGPDRVMGTILDGLPPALTHHPVYFVRPWYRQTGNIRGSVTVSLARQV